MTYRYKDQKIDSVLLEAKQNENGSYSVVFSHQENILVYSKEDFENNFEEALDASMD